MYNSHLGHGENMEQDCVVSLYQSMGRSVGEQFSTSDVSQLFGKVFHESSNAQEVHAAITKISNGNSSWTCAGHNVLDVLCEMEHRRAKKEKLYWERQLLNAMNHQITSCVTGPPFITDVFTVHNKEDIFQLCTQHYSLPSSDFGMKKNDCWKLRKVHRQSWARLVAEGLHSLQPTPHTGEALKAVGQAWGWVTLSDLFLLVEVKYDAVSSQLYTEMLKEHYSARVWESLSLWEQHQAEERVSNGAEQALKSNELLHLAQLPGAFNMYTFQDQSWSAVSFLCEIDNLCQREKLTLEGLVHRLNMKSIKLLCLHIRLATLRAQREKQSYSAVVAARQSWETWPDVSGPLRAEQAIILLKSQDNEQKVEAVSEIPQQAVLQLLVLTQEQERKQLIKLVHGISHQEVQGLGDALDTPTQESSESQSDLRSACVKQLHFIYNRLKTQSHCEPQLQDCVLHLVMDLLKLQDVQTSVLLPTLVDKSPQALLSLHEELRSDLQGQALSNLRQLLISARPTIFTDNSILPQTISHDDTSTASEKEEKDAEESQSNVANISACEQATEAPGESDICTGCGAAMAGLPYLEVLCAAEILSIEQQEAPKTETGSASEDTTASLITLAWSKPLGTETEDEEHLPPHETHLQQTTCETSSGQMQYCSTEQMIPNETASSKATHEDENAIEAFVAEDLTSSTNSSSSEEILNREKSSDVAVSVERKDRKNAGLKEQEQNTEGTSELTAPEKAFSVDSMSAVEREKTMRSLVDTQRRVEQRQQRDRERQLLKVQERLSIIQSKKAEEDPLGLKDRLKLLTHDLPQEDVQQQKAVVKERLEQLRRERSYILQSKRDKNTAGFKELLGPVGLHNTKIHEDLD